MCKNWQLLPDPSQLSKKEKRQERAYRLPTEAKWEYACRGAAGSRCPFHFGDTLSEYQANFEDNYYTSGDSPKGKYLERTCEVGSYSPNAFGLHDMHGNVLEWCADWYGKAYYHEGGNEDPGGPETGTFRVLRGGCWCTEPGYCRAACRLWNDPAGRPQPFYGFRVCFAWTS